MTGPEINKPSELVTPEERAERYGKRTLELLREDVNKFYDWKRTFSHEKDRQDKLIEGLLGECNWSLAISIVALLAISALIAWAAWPYWT